MLSAMVLLTSKITILDTSFLAGTRFGELGVELSGELAVDVEVDSSPFAKVLCEKVLDGVSGMSGSDPLNWGVPLGMGKSPGGSMSSGQNR
jgi:hypothetical protein